MIERLAVPVPEACELLGGIHRDTLYELMRAGLPSFTLGRRRMFSVEALRAWVAARAAA